MPRINIEDSILRDQRFFRLVGSLGELETALGAVVLAWDMAQRFCLKNKSVIPDSEWGKLKYGSAIIACGLAELVEGGVYVKGSSEQFAWIKQRSTASKKRWNSAPSGPNATASGRNATVFGPYPSSSSSSSSSILSLSPMEKMREISNNSEDTENLFDKRWSEYEEALSKVLVPVHQNKVRFYRTSILKHFPSLPELRSFLNPFLENLRAATHNGMDDLRTSSALFNKLTKSVGEWEKLSNGVSS